MSRSPPRPARTPSRPGSAAPPPRRARASRSKACRGCPVSSITRLVMSTTLLMARSPDLSSRCRSQAGEGATRTPARAVTLKRPPASIAAAASGVGTRGRAAETAGASEKVVRPPARAATSRAMPRIERPSGRLAVIARSSTWSLRPKAGPTGAPRGGRGSSSSPSTAMPSEVSASPSS